MSDSHQENAIDRSTPLPAPPFEIDDVGVWFAQMECSLSNRRIVSQEAMYRHIVPLLPNSIAKEVRDLIIQMPAHDPYDTLKAALLKRTTASDEARLQQLLAGVELGDRSPSQLSRYMQSLVPSLSEEDKILRRMWMNALPENVQACLASQGLKMPLSELADLADRVYECIKPKLVQQTSVSPAASSESSLMSDVLRRLASLETSVRALQQRSRSASRGRSFDRRRSSSRGYDATSTVCWFHQRYGDRARSCKPGCTYSGVSQTSGNARGSH